MDTARPRVLSGVQPTGALHLGNWLGAIRNWVALQDSHDTFFCVVDLHAITVPHDPARLAEDTLTTAALYLACGIDPARSTVFVQSHVSAHSELCWLLNCVTPLNWLERMIQFKEKAVKQGADVSTGLLDYPVLMAADILLYDADRVPVGEDQKQHLELARDIATKFNNDYGRELFTLPEPFISKAAPRIMSLRDGTSKMSKSNPSEMSLVKLIDTDDQIAEKFRKAKTDADVLPDTMEGLDGRAEARNLITIYAAMADREPADVLAQFAGQGFGAFKPELADLAVATLGPIRERLTRLLDDRGEVGRILERGAEKARDLAAPLLLDVQRTMGLQI
jgi:tryptophanyl-tRNA synthetase